MPKFHNTVEPLILVTLNFGVWVNVIILDPVILVVFASYYTEMLLYSNFCGPLFSRTCQAHEIREIKGTRKNGFYSIDTHTQDSVCYGF